MDDLRAPPPVWAIAGLALAVAAAAGFVLYFQLGSVGLDGLAVATGGVLASLLVALYYRQTAIMAEQTTLQRRQTELLERIDRRQREGGSSESRSSDADDRPRDRRDRDRTDRDDRADADDGPHPPRQH
jgi:hypothetical protein